MPGFPVSKRDTKVTVLRRAVLLDVAGNALSERGAFEEVFSVWANVFERRVEQGVSGGAAENRALMNVTLPDSTNCRTITVEDRVKIRGQEFAVVGVGMPQRIKNIIVIDVESRRAG